MPPWPASSSSEATAAAGGQRRARLLVAYLGTAYHGFALQEGQLTVASAISAALQRVAGQEHKLTCAGRTDAGVHAWGQVLSLDLPAGIDLERLQRSVNKLLAPSVLVREAAWAEAGFDARRWALSRRYRYRISCARWASPFDAGTTWHVGEPLDVRAMLTACDALLGEHDFTSFCRAVPGRPGPLVRRVLDADWSDLGDERLAFDIEATSFCHQMVRSLVGLLVEVGRGRRKAADVGAAIAARDRSAAGPIAPPHGLCLVEVKYPGGD